MMSAVPSPLRSADAVRTPPVNDGSNAARWRSVLPSGPTRLTSGLPPAPAPAANWLGTTGGEPGVGVVGVVGATGCVVYSACAGSEIADGLPAASVTAPGSTRAVTVPSWVMPVTVT